MVRQNKWDDFGVHISYHSRVPVLLSASSMRVYNGYYSIRKRMTKGKSFLYSLQYLPQYKESIITNRWHYYIGHTMRLFLTHTTRLRKVIIFLENNFPEVPFSYTKI